MTKVVFFYKRGKEITNSKALREAFDILTDGRYKIEISSAKKRSNNQNAYFHGVVLNLVRHGLYDAGYQDVKTNEDAKTVVKALFLKDRIVNKETGEVLTEYIKDTSSLTTGEFAVFIDSIVMWAAEYLSVTIPAPGMAVEMF